MAALKKEHIEKLLQLNGIQPTAPDEEVRSALISARWNENDVEVALMVLRGHVQREETEVIASRQLFNSDARVSPDMLEKLLGVRMHPNDGAVRMAYQKRKESRSTVAQMSILTLTACIIAALGISLVFMLLSIDPFAI